MPVNMPPILFDAIKELFVCACGALHYGSFQAAAVKH